MPSALTLGPDWLVLVLVVLLVAPAVITQRTGYWRVAQVLGYAASGIVTAALIAS